MSKEVAKNDNSVDIPVEKIRAITKEARRNETDAIQVFSEYAKSQGSKGYSRYYTIFTMKIYQVFFAIKWGTKMPKNFRDEYLDGSRLGVLVVSEDLIKKTILEEIEQGTHYKTIVNIVKEKLENLVELIGTQTVLLDK